MATVNHSALTGTSLHEPKGAADALVNEVFLADGAGSGSFQSAIVHGGWRYTDIDGTGTGFDSTSYALLSVVGVDTHLHDFTNNDLGRLTYTGTPDRHVHVVCDLSFKHSIGSGQEVYFQFYKNGSVLSPAAEMVATADSSTYQHVAIHCDFSVSTNDYIELYIKTTSGTATIYAIYMFVMGVPT